MWADYDTLTPGKEVMYIQGNYCTWLRHQSQNGPWDEVVRDTEIYVASGQAYIPEGAKLETKKLLTQADLLYTLTGGFGTDGFPGYTIASVTSNHTADAIVLPTEKTDANGETKGKVSTRDQITDSGISTLDAKCVECSRQDYVHTDGEVKWLPADFRSPASGDRPANTFLATCYITATEGQYKGAKVDVCGVSGKQARADFLKAVRFQGSGYMDDGTLIQPKGKCYVVSSCPVTKSGACATDKQTIAGDTSVIPLRSTVHMEGMSHSKMQDVGDLVNDYHIDLYFGTRAQDCKAWGQKYLPVKFVNY
jgi:3D (Asp-Asp-Asp) domain-containing protein